MKFIILTHNPHSLSNGMRSEAASRKTQRVFSLTHTSSPLLANQYLQHQPWRPPVGYASSALAAMIEREGQGGSLKGVACTVLLSVLIELLFLSSPQLRMSFIVFSTRGTTLMKLTEDR